MKRVVLALCVAFVLAGSAALLAGDQDFVLVNQTGLTIGELYISPASADRWGEDVLGVDTLPTGKKVTIRFPRKQSECNWDLKIVDEEKDDIVWEDIDLCKASEITLKYEGKHPTAIIK